MEDSTQIPRWVVEEDPLWEQDTHAEPNLMRWRKRGTKLFAICGISSLTCDLFDYSTNSPSYSNFLQGKNQSQGNRDTNSRPDGPADIKRYLASRYLNPNYGTFKLLDSRSLKIRDRPDLKDIS
jgi:hypothetical protein